MQKRPESVTGASRSFEDFRGDFEALAQVMEASWAESVTPPFLYSADYLSDCLASPGAGFNLAPTLYNSSGPVAFIAGFPRTVRAYEVDLKVVIAAFLTVSLEHKNRGYGILAWSELIRRAQAAGYDGVVNYCVEGEAMERMIEGSCRRLGLRATRLNTVEYLSKLLWSKTPGPSRPAEQVSVSTFLQLAAETAERSAVARIWTEEEARWQLARRNAVASIRLNGDLSGLVDGYVLEIADRNRTPCLVVDNILWDTLHPPYRDLVTQDLTAAATSIGARIAIVPVQGYANVDAFLSAGFRPSGRRIHTYLTVWSRPFPDEPATSVYLDVF